MLIILHIVYKTFRGLSTVELGKRKNKNKKSYARPLDFERPVVTQIAISTTSHLPHEPRKYNIIYKVFR